MRVREGGKGRKGGGGVGSLVLLLLCILLVCTRAKSVHSTGGSGFNDIHGDFIGRMVSGACVCS